MSTTESARNTPRGYLATATVLGLILAAAAAFWLRTASRDTTASSEPLRVPQEQLDCGDVWETHAFPRTLTVTNTTANDAEITDFQSSCGCVSITPGALTIPPGTEADIHLSVNVTMGASHDSSDFKVHIIPITTNVLPEPRGWTLRGHT
jgi:hypothetical protein